MAVWFAQKAGNISANDVFFDAPSGGNAKDISVQSDTTIILSANSYAIAIDENVTALRLSTADEDGAGAGVAGGSFTVATGSDRTINADILAGTTPCLVCSHATTYRVTVNCQSTSGVKGGTSANAKGITSSSTGRITINAYSSNANAALTGGGGGNSCMGMQVTGATNDCVINGKITGGTANALCHGLSIDSTGTYTINGNITGGNPTSGSATYGVNIAGAAAVSVSDGYTISGGSAGASSMGLFANAVSTVIIGACNLIDTLYGTALAGNLAWNATNTKTRTTPKTTGGAGTYKYALLPAAADLKSGVVVGDVTGTYEGAGGSGGVPLIGPGGLIG